MGCPAKIRHLVNGEQRCSLTEKQDDVLVRSSNPVETFFMVFTTGDFAVFCDDTQFLYKNQTKRFWGLDRISLYPLARKHFPLKFLFKKVSLGSPDSYLIQYVAKHDVLTYDARLQMLFWKAWFKKQSFMIADVYTAARVRALAEIHGFNLRYVSSCEYKLSSWRFSSVHRLKSLIKLDPEVPYRIASRINFRSKTQGFIIKQ